MLVDTTICFVISADCVKLFRSSQLPGQWIGHDKRLGLVMWPAEKGGWQQRTPYTGPRRALEEVEPALARGTGWPGAGGGRRPLAASGKPSKLVGLRVPEEERAEWEAAAEGDGKTLSEWLRDTANEAARRGRGSRERP